MYIEKFRMEKALTYIQLIIEKSPTQAKAGESVKDFLNYLKTLRPWPEEQDKYEWKVLAKISTDMLKNFENVKNFDWKKILNAIDDKLRKEERRRSRNYMHAEGECSNPPYYKSSCD